jgi:carboxyl-terminal processing protease
LAELNRSRLQNLLRQARKPAVGLVSLVFLTVPSQSQKYAKYERDLAQGMLREVASDVRKNYYDPKLHGIDWDAKVQQARLNIEKADSMDSAVSEIAALLDSLNDSHTTFAPPPRNYDEDYGFDSAVVGDRCFVTRVRPHSDAEKKGLLAGEQVLAINDHPVTRKTYRRLEYIYEELRPQPGLRLSLSDDAGHQRTLEVMAKLTPSQAIKILRLHQGINQLVRDVEDTHHALRARYFEKGEELLVIRLPQFSLSAYGIDDVIAHMRKHKGVVLDLRGNPGGFVDSVDRLLGGVFQYDQKIYDHVGRDSTKEVSVSGRHQNAYTGRLAVLVDAGSASASEIFARVVQSEHRGRILGDRSAGMVMESSFYRHEFTTDSQVFYGASVTRADLIMTDGKSLEHVGVEPDITILPTPQDIAAKRDPTMAKAATLVGGHLTPEEAGAAFPPEDPNQE